MEYSVRHRRRLRPATGEQTGDVVVAGRAGAAPRTGQLAQGSGPVVARTERPLVTELIARRTYARVRATSAKR